MTTYYHGTTPELAESILNGGFELTDNDVSNFKGGRDYDGACLYAFDNLEDAKDFICEQGYNEQCVVSFSIGSDTDIVKDTEYDDGAFILYGDYFATKNIKIEWEQK